MDAEENAHALFKYQLKYPRSASKMMLAVLDLLVAESERLDHAFFVVEIKEAIDTSYAFSRLTL